MTDDSAIAGNRIWTNPRADADRAPRFGSSAHTLDRAVAAKADIAKAAEDRQPGCDPVKRLIPLGTRSCLLAWLVTLGLLLSAELAAQPVAPSALPGQPPHLPVPSPIPVQPRTQPLPRPSLARVLMPLLGFSLLLNSVGLGLLVYMHVRRQQVQMAEEEDRTQYTEEDLMEDWEFKIVRNPYNQFERREYFEKILQEEARAGWRLVEKFDGMRIRLKRPVSQRAGDANLAPEFNPYRTVVRPNINIPRDIAMMFCLVVFLLCICFLVFAPLEQSRDPIAPELFRNLMWASAAGVIPFGAIALGLILRTLRERRNG